MFPTSAKPTDAKGMKNHRRYNHNMSQRTSLTFWCFILFLVPLHGHSAHLRPIFGRVQAKIIWFLCMTNLKTSGEHLLLRAAPWSRSLSGSRRFFTSQIPGMKDHAVATIVAENCHQITRCSCRQTGIRQKPKSLVSPASPPPWFGDFGEALWNRQDFQTRKLSCKVSTCRPIWKELQNC